MYRRTVLLSACLFLLSWNSSQGLAADWYVDCSAAQSGDGTTRETAFKTIGEGVNAAHDGDTVLVAAGQYAQVLLVRGLLEESLSLVGSGADTTTIDAGGGPCAVSFVGLRYEWTDLKPPPWQKQPRPSFRMEGFTIRNSANDAVGAVHCSNCSITIKDCNITGNSATFGASIFLDECSAAISGCELSGNSAEDGGGAIYAWASDAVVDNCVITGNAASEGGGIFSWYSEPRIVRTTLSKNSSQKGGAVFSEEGPVILVNCTLADNLANEGAGGVHCQDAVPRQSLALVMNSIIWGNGLPFSGRLSPEVSFSDIDDASFSGLDGNISAPPMFLDAAAGHYHLGSASPCIDTGDPHPVCNDQDGSRCDMGAFGGTGNISDVAKHPKLAYVTTETDPDGRPGIAIYWLAQPSATFLLHSKSDMAAPWSPGLKSGPGESWLHRYVYVQATQMYKQRFYRVATFQ